jgi:hypothetical protein
MNKEEQEKNREEWRNRLNEWKESGLTQVEYCRQNDFKISKFHYWRKRFSEKKPTEPSIVQVPMTSANRFCPIRIEIGSRYCVEVGNGYDPTALEHIIGFLSRT